MPDLRGKLALVTGLDQEIGRAAALTLAQYGARLVATELSEAALYSALADPALRNCLIATYPLDVRDQLQWSSIVEKVRNEFGAIDLLFNFQGWSVNALAGDDCFSRTAFEICTVGSYNAARVYLRDILIANSEAYLVSCGASTVNAAVSDANEQFTTTKIVIDLYSRLRAELMNTRMKISVVVPSSWNQKVTVKGGCKNMAEAPKAELGRCIVAGVLRGDFLVFAGCTTNHTSSGPELH